MKNNVNGTNIDYHIDGPERAAWQAVKVREGPSHRVLQMPGTRNTAGPGGMVERHGVYPSEGLTERDAV